MTPALGIRTCAVTGCERRVMTTADERCVYSRCETHLSALLRGAFGHPDSPLSAGREGFPRSSVSCAQRDAGMATQPA